MGTSSFLKRDMQRTVRYALTLLFMCLLIVGCSAQRAYREGNNLIANGHIERGLDKFAEALRVDPRNVEYRSAYLQTREQSISTFLGQAEAFISAEKFREAEDLYRRVLQIEAGNERALAGLGTLAAVQRHARMLVDANDAIAKNEGTAAAGIVRAILLENPQHGAALVLQRRLNDAAMAKTSAPDLANFYKKPITLEFRDATLRQVFEIISRSSGLNLLFDKDVKMDQKTSIFLKNSNIEAALYLTLMTNRLEQQVMNANTLLIYPNTPEKIKDYQELVMKTFFLVNADAKAVANAIRAMIRTKDIVTDDKLNMLMMRDSPEAIRIAEKIVALHDMAEPEVMLEVEILEVKRTRLQELGITWPTSLTLTPLAAANGGVTTLRDLRNLNSGTIGAVIPAASVNARKEDSNANILANPRIRARNHEKAKVLIGERVPNITTTATSTGFVSESISYIDVGLKLDVEPTVYLDNEVGIRIALEVSNIVGQLQTKSGSIAYQIGTRTASTVLRLKDGETQILAGLINDEDRSNASKIPLVGEIPILNRLFGTTTDNGQKTEIVLSITPRLIRNIQRPDATLAEVRTGTDSNFRLRPDQIAHMSEQALNGKLELQTQQSGASDGPIQNAKIVVSGPQKAAVGDLIVMSVNVQPDSGINAAPLAIHYDNKLLQLVSVTEGDFFKQDSGKSNFSSRLDPNGRLYLDATRIDGKASMQAGTIAKIGFRALGPTSATRMQIMEAAVTYLDGHSTPMTVPIPYTVQIQ